MASADSRWQELQQRYADMSDAEVAGLFEQKDDLTEIAQEALTAEFRKRGLVAAEAAVPGRSDYPEMPDEVSAVSPFADGIHLWDFTDVTDATSSLALLQSQEIEARLVPVSSASRQIRMDGSNGIIMQLYVAQADSDAAVRLLRKHRGLFPLAENPQAEFHHEPGDDDMFVVAEFDNVADAATAVHGLMAAHITFRKSEEQREDVSVTLIEVAQRDVDRAGEAMEEAFVDAIDREPGA